MKNQIIIHTFVFILSLFLLSGIVQGQSKEKTFTSTEFGFKINYPSDWKPLSQEEDLSSQLHDDSMVIPSGVTNIVNFCPTSEFDDDPDMFDCQIESPVYLGITTYKLKEGTTLGEFSNQKNPDENLITTTNVGDEETEVSGVSAHKITELGHFNRDFLPPGNTFGQNVDEWKETAIYLINGNIGYLISVNAENEQYYDENIESFEKIIDSFQLSSPVAIQNVVTSPKDNLTLESDKDEIISAENTTADSSYQDADVVLISHRLKQGEGSYNNIIGEVKNIGDDTVEFVKIGLTVYDQNGDLIGTDSTYSDSTTLKPNQKSSFDILSTKDNFDGMESYELSLQWRGSDGTDEYIDNAQVYK